MLIYHTYKVSRPRYESFPGEPGHEQGHGIPLEELMMKAMLPTT